MSDPSMLGLASTAVGLVNGTISLLKDARNAAKQSDDHELKDKLSEVFDSVLELKEAIGNLREENDELRKRLETRETLKWNSKRKLYFADGDPDPFCPPCFDRHLHRIRLIPRMGHSQSVVGYDCMVCKGVFSIW